MGYRIENKEINLSGIKKLTYVPSTKAGDVYRYKNTALRIFKEGEKSIDKETADYLTDISTNRILLPRKLLFYNNIFKGYTMKLVSQKGAGKRIITTPKEEFIHSVKALEEDTKVLSQKKVLLNDINPGYSLYNGELYLVNPANYTILDIGTPDSLEQLNMYQIHLLITELISADLRKTNISQSTINELKELMSLKEDKISTSSYLNDLLKNQENVKEFIKKM